MRPPAGRAALARPGAVASANAPLDTDADGMPDDWEQLANLNPNWAGDAALDPDNDGLTNRQEYESGTDPGSADSGLRLLATRSGHGAAHLHFRRKHTKLIGFGHAIPSKAGPGPSSRSFRRMRLALTVELDESFVRADKCSPRGTQIGFTILSSGLR